jgi:TrmH family RNA methyltransferase
MIARAQLKFLRSLRLKKNRAGEGLLLVEGLNVVEEALEHGRVRELFLAEDLAHAPRGRAMVERGVPTATLDACDVDALAETRTPAGAFALVENPCRAFDARALPADAIVLFAAGVADPGNLGTLIRAAAALGAAGVATAAGTVEATNPKTVRASAGMLFRVPVWEVGLRDLAAAGFALWLADARGEPVDGLRTRPARVALVVGNEPRGVDDAVRASAARTVAVRLAGGVESLNVAVAAGILLHALRALPAEAVRA